MAVDGWQQNTAYGVAATIANGQQTSGAVDLKNKTLVAVALPAALTGVALTFFAATSLAGTYKEVTDGAGTAYSVVVAADKCVPVDTAKFLGVRFLKVKSGSAEGGARTLELLVRDL